MTATGTVEVLPFGRVAAIAEMWSTELHQHSAFSDPFYGYFVTSSHGSYLHLNPVKDGEPWLKTQMRKEPPLVVESP